MLLNLCSEADCTVECGVLIHLSNHISNMVIQNTLASTMRIPVKAVRSLMSPGLNRSTLLSGTTFQLHDMGCTMKICARLVKSCYILIDSILCPSTSLSR
jgi:hypothetical protein